MKANDTDIEYKNYGFITRFYPVSDDGQKAWRLFYEQNGSDGVLKNHADSVIKQFKNAGYTVKRAKPVRLSNDELLKMLNEVAA
jgi:hypothetical protein